MIRTFSGVVAAGLAFYGTALAGDRVSRDYDVSGFDEIEVTGVYKIDLEVGPDFSLSASGREKEMQRAIVKVENGVLILAHEKKRGWMGGNRKAVKVVATMPALRALRVSGVGDVDVEGVETDEFTVRVSGVGDVEIAGACARLDARVSGVGDLDARKLECADVKVTLSGVGDASVYASDVVDARVSGVGGVDVYGSPEKVSKSDGMLADITIH